MGIYGPWPVSGTSSSTYAAGNDSRITGAAQKSSNLSDLASASSARSSLGLGSGTVEAAFLGQPAAALANGLVVSVAIANGTLTLAAQPDVPRNVTIAVTDADVSITAGTVTVSGTDPGGTAISEVLNLASALTMTGTKVFGSITSVVVAALAGAGVLDVIVAGFGNKIALPSPITASSAVKHVYLGGVRQSSPTIATGTSTSSVDASGGTYTGAKALVVWYDRGG